MTQRFDPAIFVTAQRDCIDQVRAELAGGTKQSHWMWFVFPQIAGLGSSPTAQRFALPGLQEARAYLAHPVLGDRLRQLTGLVLAAPHGDAVRIFGPVDALKFRSCMTLFRLAAPEEKLFSAALEKFFAGRDDPRTVAILRDTDDWPSGWAP
ncbi:MAG: DUF1810 domain-containing protein, partial [Rhodospirillales bacterium]